MSSQPAVSYPGPAELEFGDAPTRTTASHDVDADEEVGDTGPSTPSTPERTASQSARAGLEATAVLPYASSRASKSTRGLRAWMLTAPIDVVALLTPLLLSQNYWRGTLANAVLTVAIFASGGLYRARRHVGILDELPSIGGRLMASAAVVAIIAAERHDSVQYVGGFMRGVALSAGLVIVGRAISRSLTIAARKRRWVEHNTIIIGSGPIGLELARLLRRYPQYGLRFVGCVDAAPRQNGATPLIGTLDDLEHLLRLAECEVLVIADPDCSESTLMDVLLRPISSRCDLWAVPRLWGSRSLGSYPDHIGAIPIVKIGDTKLSGPRWAIKRASDVVFAATALVALSPLLLLCALATFLDGGRGIFFHQERIGRYGKPFKVIKFRSMRPVNEHESQTNWSIAHDRRVGPIGRFMRRTSLDELPQLWNILRGEMSVVGPRPERPYFVEKFSVEYPNYAMRHRVPVGLTGLAQVSGLRGDTPISDRARFDNYYIENWSLWLDIKVLLRTVAEVLRGGGR
ncbi:sugar transferase [Micromonospora krabiensis]|uniref:Exopolysaccharide biosynthesis polyprenyl glycosylphosphotransferase n=1 Tax=Micromonospora krabiensis TaxID=307121 RepID=A0A1C3N4Z3_9ACTN|nr:sugar transferase [Micromonospora krabiensis]SBV27616.1 exopolysaccharide biosynthesis polyprenyl glycosylphosphotransferase [Micromonospora krabiensis]